LKFLTKIRKAKIFHWKNGGTASMNNKKHKDCSEQKGGGGELRGNCRCRGWGEVQIPLSTAYSAKKTFEWKDGWKGGEADRTQKEDKIGQKGS